MNKKLKKIDKNVNKDAIEHYIRNYQTQTKNAVENIIQMSLTVKDIQDRVIDGVCNGLIKRNTFLEVIINFKRCKNE